MQDYAHLRHRLSVRSEASIIHDEMVRQLKLHLEGLPGVGFELRQNLFLVGISGTWNIRAKRLNSTLRSSNIPTQQVLSFLAQVQPDIPGLEGPTNLEVGYRLIGAQVAAAPIWLTCPDGPSLAWTLQLTAEASYGFTSPDDLAPRPVIEPTLVVQPITVVEEEEAEEDVDATGPGTAAGSDT